MRSKYLTFALIVAVAAVPATACTRTYQEAGDVAPDAGLTLHIANENFLDMDVFAVVDGVSTRIGTVTGTGAHDFPLSSTLMNRDVRIIATPIGGSGRASTGVLNLTRGQEVDFRIASVLSNSSVIIR
ncbi:MAG: hypothetical protein ABI442_00480 [Gemmatimonadaceae bacterium]